MNIETNIETKLLALVDANTALSALKGTVGLVTRKFSDNSNAQAEHMVVVHALPAERLAPNANFYKVTVEIICLSIISEDRACSTLDQLYGAAMTIVKGIVGVTLLTGLTIDGRVPLAGTEGVEGSYQFLTARADLFVTCSLT